jgi:BlaI family penicillinase repressor
MQDMVGKISNAESEVMKVLWASCAPVTEAYIRDVLGKETAWNPETIKTLLRRLLGKGAVTREKRELFYYSPALTRADFDKGRTEEFVNTVFGGDARSLLSTMLNNDILSEGDLTELKDYWKARKNQK